MQYLLGDRVVEEPVCQGLNFQRGQGSLDEVKVQAADVFHGGNAECVGILQKTSGTGIFRGARGNQEAVHFIVFEAGWGHEVL